MEKYRQFADPGTGVNPFMPPWAHYKAPLAMRAVRLLLLFPVAFLRLSLFATALAWLAFAELLCLLIPVGLLRYPLYRALSFLGCGLALFALGIMTGNDVIADHRRLKIAAAGGGSLYNAGHGSLVLANLQGLTDVLFLGLRLSPTFVFPASNGAPVRFSLLSALARASTRRPVPPPLAAEQLAEIARAARESRRGPVVVFAEGGRSNGSCVLAWRAETFEGLSSLEGTSLVALEYSKTGAYTPQHTVGTGFRHVFWLCMQPWHTVRAAWLPATSATPTVKGKALAEQRAQLRALLTRMLPGAVEVEVSCSKHPEFMAYWDASQRKRYTQQKKAA